MDTYCAVLCECLSVCIIYSASIFHSMQHICCTRNVFPAKALRQLPLTHSISHSIGLRIYVCTCILENTLDTHHVFCVCHPVHRRNRLARARAHHAVSRNAAPRAAHRPSPCCDCNHCSRLQPNPAVQSACRTLTLSHMHTHVQCDNLDGSGWQAKCRQVCALTAHTR